MDKSSTLTKIGEFGLIRMIEKLVKAPNSSVVKGIGDDAAVLKWNKAKYLLFTCDMLIEDVHFRSNMRSSDIGRKALACSISDIAAMGGLPKYAIISIGLPKNLKISFVRSLYNGINNIARRFKVDIVGGDTNRSKKIIIDVTMIGEVEKESLVLRSSAKANDLIFVTGALGGSFKSGRHLTFIPRLQEARLLVKNYSLNSMIDISDGLAQDLGHILDSSDKGALVYERAIPKHKSASIKEALYNGEDYELLFTLSNQQAHKLIDDIAAKKIKFPVTAIGQIIERKNGFTIIDSRGVRKPLKPRGFRHF